MDGTSIGYKAEASVSLPSEPKCAVCDNLDVWPERPPREWRYKQPTTIDFNNLIDKCGYCQLLKSSLIQLGLVSHDKSPAHVWTDDGRIRVNGGGFDEGSRWNLMIYTPFQVRPLRTGVYGSDNTFLESEHPSSRNLSPVPGVL